jgi:hypothetical protein
MLTLADKHLDLSSINCPQPVKSEIYLNEDNLTQIIHVCCELSGFMLSII